VSKRYCTTAVLWFILFFAGIPFHGKSQNDSLVKTVPGVSLASREDSVFTETGIASWYGKATEGSMTASGEIFHADSLTAAHKTLPMGTLVRVYQSCQ
jgi:rare lipoprotein A (peptidoglycan hydrolase)